MTEYLVVWQDDGDVIQSCVSYGGDPMGLANNDWVMLAAYSETYEKEEVDRLLDEGYSLFLVCTFPQFYGD